MLKYIEQSLMDPEEKIMVDAILSFIPEQDRSKITTDDVLFVLDALDDYLEDKGLLEYDEATGEAIYLDGDVDETEQLNYVLAAAKDDQRTLTGEQIQLIMEGEKEYGIQEGYYEECD